MSGYNDGSSFGYDVISPYDHIPLTFEQISLPSDRPFLASMNEYPTFSTVNPPQLGAVSDAKLVRAVETPAGLVEGFLPFPKLKASDIQLILLFMIVVVGILQIKMMATLDFMLKIQLANIPSHMSR